MSDSYSETREVDLLIIGGGPAGQAAAIEAASYDIQTMLVDEGPVPHSWMTRQVPRWYGETIPELPSRDVALTRYLANRPDLTDARGLGVDVRTGCACWGLFDGGVAGLYDGERAWFVRAQAIILATGSYDQPLPFAGNTLPGVLGGLGALDLLDTCSALDANRVVVLGSGAFGLEVATRFQEAGSEVLAVVDVLPEPLGDPVVVNRLDSGGVEFIPGYTIVHASGGERVEQIMLGGVDSRGNRLPGESFPIKADTLCVAIGRSPSIDLAFLAGCSFGFDPLYGGFYPRFTDELETTVPNLFVAGDLAGSADSRFRMPEIATTQGRLAAASAARRLGRGVNGNDEDRQSQHRAALASLDNARVQDCDNSLWQRAALQIATDDVVLCRCEGITRSAIEREFEVVGERFPDELKRVSRAGMGPCQGRGCRLPIATLLAERSGVPISQIAISSYRPPVRPVPLGALAAIDPPENLLHPAFEALEHEIENEVAAGTFPADQLPAVQYKIREENYLARALSEEQIATRARELGVTVRTVRVH